MVETELKLSYVTEVDENAEAPVIIVAAGSSSRMGKNKQFMEIAGIPVIARTLLNFERCGCISNIILVTRREDIPSLQLIAEKYGISKLSDIVEGGDTRQESVLKGFDRLAKEVKSVLIHDGARPLTDESVIKAVVKGLEKYPAVTCAVKPKDTIKEITPDGLVVKTLKRESLVAVQTPQGVYKNEYLDAVKKAGDVSVFTDDMSVMEAAGYEVLTVEGDYKNIKITTPEDIAAAESYIGIKE